MYVKFINPLDYRLSVENVSLDDELQKAYKEFIVNSVKFVSENAIIKGAGTAGRPIIKINKVEKTLEGKLAEAYAISLSTDKNIFKGKNLALLNAMFDLDFSEIQENTSKEFDKEFDKLKKIDHVDEIKSFVKDRETFQGKMDKGIESLKERFKKLTEALKNSKINKVDGLKELYEYKIGDVGNDIEKFETTYKGLKNKYNKILGYFETIGKRKYFDNKFLLKGIKLKSGKRYELKLKVEKLEFNDSSKSLVVKNTSNYVIHIRKSTFFIPVVSSGVIYTNLSFPQFGTSEDENGNTIVVQTQDEENEIAVGAYLNLYINNDWEIPVFAQFGLGPSKEKPLFFIGAGFSLYERITLSTGGVFTWIPELTDLSLGQQVNGTAIIEKDISYSFDTKPKFYIGLSFDISKK